MSLSVCLILLGAVNGQSICSNTNGGVVEMTTRYSFNETSEEPDISRWNTISNLNKEYSGETIRSNQLGLYWTGDIVKIDVNMDTNCACGRVEADAINKILELRELFVESIKESRTVSRISLKRVDPGSDEIDSGENAGKTSGNCRLTLTTGEFSPEKFGITDGAVFRLRITVDDRARKSLRPLGVMGLVVVPGYIMIRQPADRKEIAISRYVKGLKEYKAGRTENAIIILKESVGIDSSVIRPRMLLATIYEKIGRKDSAIKTRREIVKNTQNYELIDEQNRLIQLLESAKE